MVASGYSRRADLRPLRGDPEVRAARAQHRRASCFHERPEVLLPLTHRRHDDQREERIVQLFGIAGRRERLGRHLGDCGRIESADARGVRTNGAPHLHRASPPLLERRIVQICVGVRVENLVRKRRGFRRVDRHLSSARHARCPSTSCFKPSRSIASCRQSLIVSLTSG
jgi:hypothetical protein